MSFFRHICTTLSLFAAGLFISFSASAASAEDVAKVRAVLKEHPELVLEVLEAHGGKVLDLLQRASEDRRRDALHKQWEADVKVPKKVALNDRPVGGALDAPVTIVEFSDFLCTYCRKAAFTVGSLMKEFPGKVKLVFKFNPKDEKGRVAGAWFLAAYHMDKAKAWKLYALTFDRQQQVEADVPAGMKAIAAEVGFDVKRLEAEVKGQAARWKGIIDGDMADAKALGFVGTPYFLVNDMVLRGALPMDNFVDATELALKKKASR